MYVRRLHNIDRDHQQAVRRHHRLRVVALLEPAVRHRHDTRFLVGEIDLIGARAGSFHRRSLAPDHPASCLSVSCLRLTLRHPGLILGPLTRMALRRSRLDHRLCADDLGQPLLAPCQLLGNLHPVGNVGLVSRLGAPQ